ncbi:MAG: DUF488 domain-containing protein [Ignavibacteriaceae bacterium]|nr:DUF488 domain-containing protein [Ignavibacteriaceae bacterium]
MDLQKYLFLLNQGKDDPFYEFIPYKFGCYSFQANQDLSTLNKYTIVKESDNFWNLEDKTNYLNQLKIHDRILITKLYSQFRELRGDALIKYVYEKYPYYAIHSTIAERLLSTINFKTVQDRKPKSTDQTLFTIGYEGKTVEYFTNQLINADVKVLCDVRKNPLSMKYGFSKNQLKNIVENVGINYLHFPELGIASDKRKELNIKNDYDRLFSEYERTTLRTEETGLEKLYQVLLSNKRIALTCFEADHNYCHRSRTAKALSIKFENNYKIIHI